MRVVNRISVSEYSLAFLYSFLLATSSKNVHRSLAQTYPFLSILEALGWVISNEKNQKDDANHLFPAS